MTGYALEVGQDEHKAGETHRPPQRPDTTPGSKLGDLGDLSVELGGSHAARAKSLVLDGQKVTWPR